MPETRSRRAAAARAHLTIPTRLLRGAGWLAVAALSGCAIYHAKPLKPAPAASMANTLSMPVDQMPVPALRKHAFDPSDGLDVTETAMLAVANNPQLAVMRDELGIARAQAFAAGLLPDPQLSGSKDLNVSKGPGLGPGYSLGLGFDIGSLLTRSSRVASARASQRQVHLQLLWAEWQTIARARLLFDQVQSLRWQKRRLLDEYNTLEQFQGLVHAAMKEGNLDYATANSGLNAVANVRNLLGNARRRCTQAEQELRTLLGLAPDAPLYLVGDPWQPRPSSEELQQADQHLARRRPDLLALKTGYEAQQANVRAAILGQFPDIQIGFTRSSDTSHVTSNTLGVSLNLPLFNANRGQIAVARATRQALADDYRARLLATRNDMQRLKAQMDSLDSQIADARQHARRLDKTALDATHSWNGGDLDWPTWLSVRASALDADLVLSDLEQERASVSIALETLLGGDWSDQDAAHPTLSSTSEPNP